MTPTLSQSCSTSLTGYYRKLGLPQRAILVIGGGTLLWLNEMASKLGFVTLSSGIQHFPDEAPTSKGGAPTYCAARKVSNTARK